MTRTMTISGDASARTGTSREWASRPDDQRFTSLDALIGSLQALDSASSEVDIEDATAARVIETDGELFLRLSEGAPLARLTNWSTAQLAERVDMRSTLFNKLGEDGPAGAQLAALVLNHGITHRLIGTARTVRGWVASPPSLAAAATTPFLRSITSQVYGRITDSSVARAVKDMNDEAGGRWKVPGALEFVQDQGLVMNPNVEVTRDSTTLYGSDRDVYIFLVDDRNPIEIAPGDVVYRGFVLKNSSVGKSSLVLYTFYFRGVCCNRLLWGVEGFQEFEMAHFRSAPERFIRSVIPSLTQFTDARTDRITAGVLEAKRERFGDDEEAKEFMIGRKVGLSMGLADRVLERCREEEERDVRSLWDISMGLTALARDIPFQDKREELEVRSKKVLDMAAAQAT